MMISNPRQREQGRDLGVVRIGQKVFHSWNVLELASGGTKPEDVTRLYGISPSSVRRHFASALAQGRAEFEANLRQLKDEMASREGCEAIYWDRIPAHVRVCHMRLTNASVVARIRIIPSCDENEYSWPVYCRFTSFHREELLWTASFPDRFRIFFSPDIIMEVTSIIEVLPLTDEAEFYSKHYPSIVKPLYSFLVRAASRHLNNLESTLDRIERQKQVPTKVRAALQALAAWLPSYPSADGIGLMLNFISEAESEAGKTLTDGEAGQLIREAYLVGRVLGGPF